MTDAENRKLDALMKASYALTKPERRLLAALLKKRRAYAALQGSAKHA